MAHQDIEGWPLGLRPLNARVGGLMRNLDLSAGSVSFDTLVTGSPTTSTISSSDLDTESTGSFFHDKSKTLGSLIGVSSILEMSRRSTKGRTTEILRDKKIGLKPKPWLFSLCSKLTTDAVIATNSSDPNSKTPSLGHFLEVERTAASTHRSNQNPLRYGPNDYSPVNATVTGLNSLFIDGLIAPHQSVASGVASSGTRSNAGLLGYGNVFGVPLLFPCLCGQLIK